MSLRKIQGSGFEGLEWGNRWGNRLRNNYNPGKIVDRRHGRWKFIFFRPFQVIMLVPHLHFNVAPHNGCLQGFSAFIVITLVEGAGAECLTDRHLGNCIVLQLRSRAFHLPGL